MSLKAVFRSVVALAVLFIMLYVGMNNTQNIEFSFPLALKSRVSEPAALIFFGVFAIGFLAGTLLTAGGKKGGGSRDK